jgi:hypothetical protein
VNCTAGVKGSGVAGERVRLRWYGSGRSGPLALYKDYVRRGELESGNLAQVCIRDRCARCSIELCAGFISYVVVCFSSGKVYLERMF